MQEGFRPRVGDVGHDTPVLVREDPPSPLGVQALARWDQATRSLRTYPPCSVRGWEEMPPESCKSSTQKTRELACGAGAQKMHLKSVKAK